MLEDRIVFRVHEKQSAFIPSTTEFFLTCEENKQASDANANMDDGMTIAEVISLYTMVVVIMASIMENNRDKLCELLQLYPSAILGFQGRIHSLFLSKCFNGDTTPTIVEGNDIQAVIAKMHSRELFTVNKDSSCDIGASVAFNQHEIEHNRVLDLNDDGERWEGDVLHNEPYGWGVLYDSENRKMYEGFRLNEVNMCYGIQYYSDIQKIEYEGGWCNGKRWGRGIQYDRNGNTMFDGEWMNDEHLQKRVEVTSDDPLLHNHIEELTIADNSCNGKDWETLDLELLPNLRELQVGDDCCEAVVRLLLHGKSLERVVIGENSFTEQKYDYPEAIRPACEFALQDCERLKELQIGRFSFSDFSRCSITDVRSLEVVEIGDLNERSYNFYNATLVLESGFRCLSSFVDAPHLRSLVLGRECFDDCCDAVFQGDTATRG